MSASEIGNHFTVILPSIPKYLLVIQDTGGARLGCNIMSRDTDVTLKDMSVFVTFYIGGTKVGYLCGEVVVFVHNNRFVTSREILPTKINRHF